MTNTLACFTEHQWEGLNKLYKIEWNNACKHFQTSLKFASKVKPKLVKYSKDRTHTFIIKLGLKWHTLCLILLEHQWEWLNKLYKLSQIMPPTIFRLAYNLQIR